ncbi:transposase [Salmonella enterica]|nr:transposase [Salmonella enterica]EIK4652894.1 transposase [Salmonella enterica]EJI4777804.1 transposase [Salmonella enterica]EJU7910853.1 transposase [Salmonella enterica]EKH0500349.1 transposase [Salmonella enterica]
MSTISPDNGHRTLNNRAWIHEDLHLRFEKKVHDKQISKRISIPRTTLQSLFRHFARSGLNWPVPEHISPEQLKQLLYTGKSQQYEPVPTREISEKHRRPNFSAEFKLHLVELSMQPDTNVARLAREHGINDNLLFNWRYQYKQGKLNCRDNLPVELLPVSIVPPPVAPAPLTESSPADVPCCEVVPPRRTPVQCPFPAARSLYATTGNHLRRRK